MKVPTRSNLINVLTSKTRGIDPHATRGTLRAGVCSISWTMCAKDEEEIGIGGSFFNGRWSLRWWRDENGEVDGYYEWAVGVAANEYRNVGVYEGPTGDWSEG